MDITQFVTSHRVALLVGDHNAYRAQLSRQLLATRKRLGRATNKREKFVAKPVTAEDIGKNNDFVHLSLLTSERAWAHAMHIKTTHAKDNSGKGITGSTRSHIISRLHKAATVARDLVEVLQNQSESKATEQDVLEGRAYLAMLAGSEEFEKQSEGQRSSDGQASESRWKQCLSQYAQARVIYSALLSKEKKEIYRDLLTNTIDPTIRYAAYQAHISRTIAIPAVAKKYFPRDDQKLVEIVEKYDAYALKDKPQAETSDEKDLDVQEIPSSITWRGRKANIVDASIGQALASVSAAEARLSSFLKSNKDSSTKDKAAAYDDILIASQDATDAAKRATDELEKEGVDESDRRMQDLRVTSLSVNYNLVSWRVGRNRVLIGDDDGLIFRAVPKKKSRSTKQDSTEQVADEEPRGKKLARLRERVVLYDAIIQSINSVKDLPGTMRDVAFVGELDSSAGYFRALKCINISYSHTLLDNHTNALALLKRAQDLLTSSSSASATASAGDAPPTLEILPARWDALQSQIGALLARMHARVEMHGLELNAEKAAAKTAVYAAPWAERLQDYPTPGTHVDLNNLVSYPPKFEPVPIKPIFLDVAFNYIEYPGRAATQVVEAARPLVDAGAAEPETQPSQKKGWFGFGR